MERRRRRKEAFVTVPSDTAYRTVPPFPYTQRRSEAKLASGLGKEREREIEMEGKE